MRSRDTRLAVMFALRLTEDQAGVGDIDERREDGNANARTWSRSPTSVRIRSCHVIRSSTTATSAPRGLNGASRSLSMKRGRSTYGSAPRMARLNRSTCPV
jgi:hypothetical protein